MVASNTHEESDSLVGDREILQSIEQARSSSLISGSVWQAISAEWFIKWKTLVKSADDSQPNVSKSKFIRFFSIGNFIFNIYCRKLFLSLGKSITPALKVIIRVK